MPTPHRRRLLLAGLLALVAACAAPPSRPTFPDIRFTDAPAIRLDVAALDVREEYQPPFRAPNVDHLFPVPPMRAAENWARDRLKPTGRSGRAVFILRNASVIETELPKKREGLTGAFTTEPAQRYDLTLQATVQIVDAQGVAVRIANVQTTRSQSVLEGITPNDRDRAWYDMEKAAMADFDKQMDAEIRNNFGTYYNQ
jgi:hypothetical protein